MPGRHRQPPGLRPPPPRRIHAHPAVVVARLLGIDAAYALFCPNSCCTDRRTL